MKSHTFNKPERVFSISCIGIQKFESSMEWEGWTPRLYFDLHMSWLPFLEAVFFGLRFMIGWDYDREWRLRYKTLAPEELREAGFRFMKWHRSTTYEFSDVQKLYIWLEYSIPQLYPSRDHLGFLWQQRLIERLREEVKELDDMFANLGREYIEVDTTTIPVAVGKDIEGRYNTIEEKQELLHEQYLAYYEKRQTQQQASFREQ